MKKVLTIAGSDSCGGAGIQGDLKSFSANFTYGMSVICALTAQNTMGVDSVLNVPKNFVEAQLDSIFTDIGVDGVKIGMVSESENIRSIAKKLKEYKCEKIILDPVMISKSGFNLLEPKAIETLIKELIPLALVVTPNIPEAIEILKSVGKSMESIESLEEMKEAAKIIHNLGCKNVLVKGGHRDGKPIDILYDGKEYFTFISERVESKNTHGTGCSLSSAICAFIARGFSVNQAVKLGKDFVYEGIKNSFSIGEGVGPINHFHKLYKEGGYYNVK